MIPLAFIPMLGSLLGKMVDKAVPDKDQAQKLKADLNTQLLQIDHAEFQAAAQIVMAEAQGDSWLQRSWRPILMLTFGALIVARWLGWAAPGLSETEYLALWEIVKIGLGGYVVGRSGEKIAAQLKGGRGA